MTFSTAVKSDISKFSRQDLELSAEQNCVFCTAVNQLHYHKHMLK